MKLKIVFFVTLALLLISLIIASTQKKTPSEPRISTQPVITEKSVPIDEATSSAQIHPVPSLPATSTPEIAQPTQTKTPNISRAPLSYGPLYKSIEGNFTMKLPINWVIYSTSSNQGVVSTNIKQRDATEDDVTASINIIRMPNELYTKKYEDVYGVAPGSNEEIFNYNVALESNSPKGTDWKVDAARKIYLNDRIMYEADFSYNDNKTGIPHIERSYYFFTKNHIYVMILTATKSIWNAQRNDILTAISTFTIHEN